MQRKKLKENKGAVNIQASVENTVCYVNHPFGGHLCKMPVRGKKKIKTIILPKCDDGKYSKNNEEYGRKIKERCITAGLVIRLEKNSFIGKK